MSLEGPMIHLHDSILARLVPLLKPTVNPAGVGLLDAVMSGDWSIDTDAGVQDFISAYGARPNVAILATLDTENEVVDTDKSQSALDIRFTIGLKLAITLSSKKPYERMNQDLFLLPKVKELLVRWRPTPYSSNPAWAWHPIVMENSQRFRLPEVSVRIFTFSIKAERACTMMNP